MIEIKPLGCVVVGVLSGTIWLVVITVRPAIGSTSEISPMCSDAHESHS